MNIFTSILLTTILASSIFSWIQTDRLNESKAQYQALRVEVLRLQQKSIEQAEQFSNAQKKAVQDIKIAEQKTKAIMNEKVPSDCQGVIKWGIKQAKILS